MRIEEAVEDVVRVVGEGSEFGRSNASRAISNLIQGDLNIAGQVMAARNGRAVDELIEVLRNGSGKAKVTSNGHRLALSVGAERAWMAGERGDGARKAVRRWRAGRGRGGRGGGSRSRPGGGSEAQADGRRARELSG